MPDARHYAASACQRADRCASPRQPRLLIDFAIDAARRSASARMRARFCRFDAADDAFDAARHIATRMLPSAARHARSADVFLSRHAARASHCLTLMLPSTCHDYFYYGYALTCLPFSMTLHAYPRRSVQRRVRV